MIRVLFVDDELNILNGLRRSLMPCRGEFDTIFVPCGADALARLAEGGIDIVISDMRMPGMDGATLLEHVRKEYPSTIRMILSGQSTKSSVIQAIASTHQFFSKPCDTDTLVGAIRLVGRLFDLLPERSIRDVCTAASRLSRSTRKREGSFLSPGHSAPCVEEFATFIHDSPASTMRLLQIVNASFFGCKGLIVNVLDCADYLPPFTAQAISQSTYECDPGSKAAILVERLEHRSRLIAQRARDTALASTGNRRVAEWAYTAGLLSQIGDILTIAPLDTANSITPSLEGRAGEGSIAPSPEAAVSNPDPPSLEGRNLTGRAAGYLIGLWGLPEQLVPMVCDATPGGFVYPRAHGPLQQNEVDSARKAVRTATESILDCP